MSLAGSADVCFVQVERLAIAPGLGAIPAVPSSRGPRTAGMSPRRFHRRGFTLTEALTASAVLGFSVLAISQAISAGQTQTHESLHAGRAIALAEALMEEILSLPYRDPNGLPAAVPGTPRDQLNSMDDYNGFSEPLGQVKDAAGAVYGGAYSRFARSATVRQASMTVPGFSAGGPGLSIKVTVTDHRGRTWTAARFIPEPLTP
jgi:hypothetical protein